VTFNPFTYICYYHITSSCLISQYSIEDIFTKTYYIIIIYFYVGFTTTSHVKYGFTKTEALK